MGLGPPVCTKCEVLYEYKDNGIRWNCPVCNALVEDCKANLYELTEEEREAYMDKSSEVRAEKKRKARECSLKR